MDQISGAKNALRQRLLLARNLQHQQAAPELSIGLAQNLISLCRNFGATTIACYLSFGTEPSTIDFLAWASATDTRVMLPISRPDGELDWVYQAESQTQEGIFGFAEAIGEPANLDDATLIFMPALAVDRAGNRLGKGKGYYDRAIDSQSNVPRYAVVYDAEVLDELPHEPHDVRVTGFVTESRIGVCSL